MNMIRNGVTSRIVFSVCHENMLRNAKIPQQQFQMMEKIRFYSHNQMKLVLPNLSSKNSSTGTMAKQNKYYSSFNIKEFSDYKDRMLKELEYNGTQIKKNSPLVATPPDRKPSFIIDPKWEFIYKQTKKDEPEMWSEDRIQELWINYGNELFPSKEDFYDSLKSIGAKKEVIRRLRLMFPHFSESSASFLADKFVSFISEEKVDHTSSLQVQAITDRIDTGKSSFWRFANSLARPKPRLTTIFQCIDRMMNIKISWEEFEAVAKNFSSNNPNHSQNPIQAVYDNFTPIHSPKEIRKVIEPKVYEPHVYRGIARGHGKRKAANANVFIKPGEGLFTINGRSYLEYFSHDKIRINAFAIPLKLFDVLRQFDIKAMIKGGGQTGQSEALSLAICKALAKYQPEYSYVLRKLSLFTTDSRVVERKKPGQKKARKKFQWVKR